jgi:TonB family protein
MMMHKKSNNPIQRVKYAIYLPIAIALLFLNHPKATAESQTIKGKVVVSGTVKNADGMPIVGAPVNFKGDNSGTLTDEEGSFKLFTIPGKQTLVITHLGSQNREIPLVLTSETSHRRLDIILGESKTRKTIIGSSTINSKLTPSETKENSSESDIFEIVEEMPKFQENLNSYISKNTRYPEEAKKQNIGGIVHVKFTIEKDGSISNIKIIKGVDPLLDEEVIRVIENMPKWKPGKHNGKAVRVNFTMPITFKL